MAGKRQLCDGGSAPDRARLKGLYNAYLSFRSRLAGYDLGYQVFIAGIGLFRPTQRALRASTGNDIVIDGFPRSANTYFVSFFEIAQNHPVSIGHHLHESWQFRFAERHGIPCVVLVREPLAAVSSALLRDPRANAATLLGNYVRLYRNMLRHRQRSVIAPFDLVVSDANRVIEAVNVAYGTAFATLPSERRCEVAGKVAAKDRAAFGKAQLDPTRIAAPSAEKETIGAKLRKEIEARHGALLGKARDVYQEVLACAPGSPTA